MKDKCILTAESVTEGHPDKLCDAIADTVLDACLRNDPTAHVACEVMATAGKIIVAGEITATELPDIPAIVCRTVRETGYGGDYEVEVITHDQSADIAGAVREGGQLGAGDQGIMYGYACSETESLLPLPVVLAHRLTRLLTSARKTGTILGLKPDGKAQVSVEYEFGLPSRITAVVLSCQHEADKDMEQLRREVMEHVIAPALRDFSADQDTEVLISDMALEQAVRAVFDLTPSGIIRTLGLDKPIFAANCNYGHFTHPDAPWERTDRADALSEACEMAEAGVLGQ